MKFTYYGHSCFLIDTGTHKLLFDPFISPNDKASEINIEAIEADYILVSHGHEDHVADLERLANQTGASIISNFEIVSYFGAKGIDGHPMNHGGSASFPFGRVKMVNAIHSSVLPDGTYGGNPAGFVVQTKERCFYYAGDTALTYDMKLIPEMGFDLDFAILPIGDNFTMGPVEAVKAAEFIECNNIIGVHFDTFGYIEIDHSAARRQFENQGNQLHLLEIGQSVQV
jgi:L-ascorbate metabolism protein UlaG (beta-lactamase superfamily)